MKIYAGDVNAITGKPYTDGLHAGPQDYVVCPDQLWLDGINTGHGTIRQFVAMPLGLGYTIEAAITGEEKYGGLQVVVFEPKPGRFPEKPPPEPETGPVRFAHPERQMAAQPMGLGAGGVMKQKIYPDLHGIDAWDQNNYGRVVVHSMNSAQFFEITGIQPPPSPMDAKTYTKHGLPWFDLYDETKGTVAPSDLLSKVKTITERDKERGGHAEGNQSIDVSEKHIKKIRPDNERKKE